MAGRSSARLVGSQRLDSRGVVWGTRRGVQSQVPLEDQERQGQVWGQRTKKQDKARRDMLRRMIDAGVFGPPVLDGRCHEW
jgi:hypothetical protein